MELECECCWSPGVRYKCDQCANNFCENYIDHNGCTDTCTECAMEEEDEED